MKQKLYIILFVLLAQNLWAQIPAKQPAAKASSQRYTPKKQSYSKRTKLPYRADTVKNTDFSLNGQYRFMLSRSRFSFGSKLINPVRLDAVWKSVNDTLRKERVELKNTKAKIAEQEKTITSLKTEISGKESTLNDTTAKVDEISFLGVSFTKGTYNIIVWSIIAILAIALFIVVARSAKNIIEAKHRTQLYDEISTEYQAYKVKSNEQQRKLARELQDERNIVEELKNKS